MADSTSLCFGLLLAAGSSSRFGSDKRLHPLPNSDTATTAAKTIGLASLERWLSACNPTVPPSEKLDQIFVVTRPNDAFAALVTQFLTEQQNTPHTANCSLLTATDADQGMGHTLASAVAQIPSGALIIGLADMPWVAAQTLQILARKLRESTATSVIQPRYNGAPGNPLGFGRSHRDALAQLSGDQGARQLVRNARINEAILDVDVQDPGILYDIDQPADLKSP